MNHIEKAHSPSRIPETDGQTMNALAPFYDKMLTLFSLGREQKFRAETVTLAELKPGEHVLEVGCGTGSLSLAAREYVGGQGRVAGIDPAPKMIEVARQKAAKTNVEVDFRVGIIENLPYPDNSFDAALSSLMMHHLPDHLKREGIAEVSRVLKPGGRLAIIDLDPTRFSLANLFHPTNKEHPGQKLRKMMEEAGYVEVVIKKPQSRGMTFLIGKKVSSQKPGEARAGLQTVPGVARSGDRPQPRNIEMIRKKP